MYVSVHLPLVNAVNKILPMDKWTMYVCVCVGGGENKFRPELSLLVDLGAEISTAEISAFPPSDREWTQEQRSVPSLHLTVNGLGNRDWCRPCI